MFLLPRFDVPATYHDFADKRTVAGVPNFGDVASNLGFLLAGLYGTFVAIRRRGHFLDRRELAPWLALFAAIALTAFGSSYYHLKPDNGRLFWDRLPMTLGFMGLFSALIAERVSVRAGAWLLFPLVLCGIGALEYWRSSLSSGTPDLRPYALVQAYPLVAVIVLLALFPPRYSRGYDYIIALAFYAAAKLFEVLDKAIFDATGRIISGHTLKHVAAAAGSYWLARMLALRTPVHQSPACAEAAARGR